MEYPYSPTINTRSGGELGTPISRIRFDCWRDIGHGFLPNVQDEPRAQPARLVLLGARDVTDVLVGSGAWFGSFPTYFFTDVGTRNRASASIAIATIPKRPRIPNACCSGFAKQRSTAAIGNGQ